MDDLEIVRKRLLFRSVHRGTKEADNIFGPFALACLNQMSAAQLAAYEALLEEADPDLFNWIVCGHAVPAHLRSDIFDMIVKFNAQHPPAV